VAASLGGHYLQPEDVPSRQAAVSEAALAAGREPDDVERAINVMQIDGDASSWANQVAHIASELGFSMLLVGAPSEDPIGFVCRLREDVAPRVRELL
jgi:hypothetical protein